MLFDDVRALSLFDGVTDEQIRTLVAQSEEVPYEDEEVLWAAGAPSEFWWINLDGHLDMVRVAGGEETVVGQFTEPGRWAGGFGVWDPRASYFATGRGSSTGRVLKVPNAALRDLIADLPLVSHLAQGMFTTARSIESGARQREAMVRLGTLSAGLAHELNNPAAAATRAVDSLEGTMGEALASLDRLARGDTTADEFTALGELRREAMGRDVVVDPLALVDGEDRLTSWLSSHGVQRDWMIGPALAARGLDIEWCERMAALLSGPALTAGFEWVASTLTLETLLVEIKEATGRISGLVASVKSYTQMDRGALQRIVVTEGIESTLVMLNSKLHDGVEVVRDYDPDVPPIEAFSGELNQVWTNLIDNAADAMAGRGTLTISTRLDGGEVQVAITDTGAGMTPEVAARAFETFFTTKEVGKGTGLGLDIARRIVVERHHGTIEIGSSRPGAQITVRLPLRQTPTGPGPLP